MTVTPVCLGIDPQASRLGLALVEFEAPHRTLWADTVSINEVDGGWMYQQVGEALWTIDHNIALPFKWELSRIGIEQPPYVNNHDVYRNISIVFGLVGAECHRRWPWAPQVSCGVGQWKKAILGNGSAKKAEVLRWAHGRALQCDWDEARCDVLSGQQDSADALAIATYAAQVEVQDATSKEAV